MSAKKCTVNYYDFDNGSAMLAMRIDGELAYLGSYDDADHCAHDTAMLLRTGDCAGWDGNMLEDAGSLGWLGESEHASYDAYLDHLEGCLTWRNDSELRDASLEIDGEFGTAYAVALKGILATEVAR